MNNARALRDRLQERFEVDLCDGLLSVGDWQVDVTDFPNCAILGEEPIPVEELILRINRLWLQEQANQANFQLYDMEDQVIARGQLQVRLETHVLKAWGLLELPIELVCSIQLDSLQMKVEFSQGGQFQPILKLLTSLPVRNLLELKSLEAEIPLLNRYCCVCSKPHGIESEMLRLFPCSDQLCLYIAQTQNIGNRIGESSLALLAKLLLPALMSRRQELICDPFPTLFQDKDTYVLHPTEKRDLPLAQSLAQELVQHGWSGVEDKRMGYWLMTSTRSYVVEREQHPFRPHQLFVIFANSPAEEEKFTSLKRQHGSVYAFHGSPLENFHSVLHNGLKNASGTKLQLHGAAYGKGIYLSPTSGVSVGYSMMGARAGQDQFYCMAIVEAIDLEIKKSDAIWVQPREDLVQIRFLIAFSSSLGAYDTRMPELKSQLDKLNVF